MRGERIEVRALDIVDNRHGSKVEAFASAIHITNVGGSEAKTPKPKRYETLMQLQSVRSVPPGTDITMMKMMFMPHRELDPAGEIAFYGMTSSIHDTRDLRWYKDNSNHTFAFNLIPHLQSRISASRSYT
jgi:hypothetical protein